MESTLLSNEASIRLIFFLSVFLLMACWELLAPRRNQDFPRRIRWPSNIGLVAFNTLLLRIVMPISAIGLAQITQSQSWGLLHQLPLPAWLALLLGIILLDLAIYLQHVMFHALPGLWRLHRMHHADLLLITPDMHRAHHSILPQEAYSKFGFNLSLWDHCLGTYRAQPEKGHEGMTIGIDQFRSTRDLGLDRMLVQPFRDVSGSYSINRPVNHDH